MTDVRGEFRLPPGIFNTVPIGKPTRVLVRLRNGVDHESTVTAEADGLVTIELPSGP